MPGRSNAAKASPTAPPPPACPALQLRMKASRRMPVTIGGVDCRLLQYSVRGMEEAAAPQAGKERRQAAEGTGAL